MNPTDQHRKKAWGTQGCEKAQTLFTLPGELLESLFTSVDVQMDKIIWSRIHSYRRSALRRQLVVCRVAAHRHRQAFHPHRQPWPVAR